MTRYDAQPVDVLVFGDETPRSAYAVGSIVGGVGLFSEEIRAHHARSLILREPEPFGMLVLLANQEPASLNGPWLLGEDGRLTRPPWASEPTARDPWWRGALVAAGWWRR